MIERADEEYIEEHDGTGLLAVRFYLLNHMIEDAESFESLDILRASPSNNIMFI